MMCRAKEYVMCGQLARGDCVEARRWCCRQPDVQVDDGERCSRAAAAVVDRLSVSICRTGPSLACSSLSFVTSLS